MLSQWVSARLCSCVQPSGFQLVVLETAAEPNNSSPVRHLAVVWTEATFHRELIHLGPYGDSLIACPEWVTELGFSWLAA
eukprot:969558-Pleurochrysis_carterae.AAC.3